MVPACSLWSKLCVRVALRPPELIKPLAPSAAPQLPGTLAVEPPRNTSSLHPRPSPPCPPFLLHVRLTPARASCRPYGPLALLARLLLHNPTRVGYSDAKVANRTRLGLARGTKTCCPMMMSRQAEWRQLCWRIIGKMGP
jgi:hypothetical protein